MNTKKIHRIGLLFVFTSIVGAVQKQPNAGILPYSYNREGYAQFLIAEEQNYRWCDFGGRAEVGETVRQTALREAGEETRFEFGRFAKRTGFAPATLSDEQASALFLDKAITHKLVHPQGYYVMYLAKVPYISAHKFNRAPKNPHYEKRRYRWVSACELVEAAQQPLERTKIYYNHMPLRRQFVDLLRTQTMSDFICQYGDLCTGQAG